MRRFSVLSLVLLGLAGLARAEGLLVLHVDFNTLQQDRRALSSLLKRAATNGYNAVLWEIENKIRFDCCPESAAPDAFTKEEFREILAEAKGRPIVGGVDLKGEDVPQDMHLFLLGGQSNMSGRGTLSETNRIDHERIFVMTPSGGWRPAVEPFHWEKPRANGAGLAASFARAYADAHPGVAVGLVPVAYGGSPIFNWQPGRVHYTNAVAYARLARQRGEFKGFLWHQGESDSFSMERVRGYLPLFTNAIVRLRRELGIEDVPFVAGELGPYLKDWRDRKRPNIYWREMNAEIARGVKLLPHAALAPSDGLLDVRADRIHFETPSLRRFGLRYYSAYAELQKDRE